MSKLKCEGFCLKNQLTLTAEQACANAESVRVNACRAASGSLQRANFEKSAAALDLAANKTQAVADGIKTEAEGGLCNRRGLCGLVVQLK